MGSPHSDIGNSLRYRFSSLRYRFSSLRYRFSSLYESANAYGRYKDTKSIQDRTRRVLQHHARLGTSFDSIWIIDSLDLSLSRVNIFA
jgi:hypothetical protein